jgi:hypothetical protein
MRMPRRRAADSLCFLLTALLGLGLSVSALATSVSVRGPKAAGDHGLSATATGVVVDEKGRPVVDAEAEVIAPAWALRPGQRAQTDAAGRFLIPSLVNCRTYLLKVSRSGFAPELLTITPCGTAAEYRLTLQRGATASGRVVDETGRPVQGAWVGLFHVEREMAPPYRAISGPDGHFDIPDLPAGRFELAVTHRAFPPLHQNGIVVQREARSIDLGRLALSTGKSLQGQVLDPQGRPLAGVHVWRASFGDPALKQGQDGHPDPGPTAITGADGRFEVARSDLNERLSFCRTGYRSYQAYVLILSHPKAPRPARIVLEPAPPLTRVSGRVLDETGRPIPGARVQRGAQRVTGGGCIVSRWWDPCEKPEPFLAIADAGGRFAFDLSGSSTTDLSAEAAGYLRGTLTGIAFGPGQNPGEIKLVLRRGGTVTGRVLAPDGSAAAGARVYAEQDSGTMETIADARGRYRLAGLEPGWRELFAEFPDQGQARRRLELATGTRRLDLILDGQKERAVAGRVVGPDGEPLAGVYVRIDSFSSGYTGEDGRFRLVLPRGNLLVIPDPATLQASKEGYFPSLYPFKASETPIDGLEIRLEKGRTLAGRILGVEPEHLSSVQVRASQGERGESQGVVSRDGTYRIDDLGPGAWTVTASFDRRTARKTLGPGAGEETLDLEIPPSHEVRGKVVDPDGGPVSGARLQFLDSGESLSSYWTPSTNSREDGTFSIPLQDGTYKVLADQAAYAPALQDAPSVRVGGAAVDDLEIRLQRGATLRGRILGMQDSAAMVSVTRETVSRSAIAQPDGTYLLTGLGPGEWEVETRLPTEGTQRIGKDRISLTPGDVEAVLDIDLSLGPLTLAGRLTSGDEPLSTQVFLLGTDGEPLDWGALVEDEEKGIFRFPSLRPGRYILKIEDYYRDRVLLRPVDLSSDREITIDLLQPESP